MNTREAILIAKVRLVIEQICTNRGKRPPSEFTDRDFAVLYLIRKASQFAYGEKNAGSPFSYEELLEKKLQPLLNNGMVSQRELERLQPILKEYQVHETDDRFVFLHAVLNLIPTIPDKSAQELLKKQQEESLHQRASENPSVPRPTQGKKWGPPSDGDEFGANRD